MRNIIVRSIKSFEYTCKAANINTCTVDTITVKTPTNLKHPERQLAKYMPEGYTFMATIGDPTPTIEKYFMETKTFLANAKPYVPQEGDEVEE